jgi:protein-S-isoprenylcysteine O-methyltransferase Ste14
LEFEYARTTASEAMQDRHTMINFYLLVAGVVASGVVAVLGQNTELPKAAGTVLLWLLCGIGWLYFLKLIRFRQAWHDSARAMNQIKDFYIQHAKDFEPDVLRDAFRWKIETLPPPDKPWTAYFYSAMLIGFLNSVAYMAGGALLDLDVTRSSWLVLGLLALFGLAFFAFHVWLYFAFLKPEPSSEATRDVQSKDG